MLHRTSNSHSSQEREGYSLSKKDGARWHRIESEEEGAEGPNISSPVLDLRSLSLSFAQEGEGEKGAKKDGREEQENWDEAFFTSDLSVKNFGDTAKDGVREGGCLGSTVCSLSSTTSSSTSSSVFCSTVSATDASCLASSFSPASSEHGIPEVPSKRARHLSLSSFSEKQKKRKKEIIQNHHGEKEERRRTETKEERMEYDITMEAEDEYSFPYTMKQRYGATPRAVSFPMTLSSCPSLPKGNKYDLKERKWKEMHTYPVKGKNEMKYQEEDDKEKEIPSGTSTSESTEEEEVEGVVDGERVRENKKERTESERETADETEGTTLAVKEARIWIERNGSGEIRKGTGEKEEESEKQKSFPFLGIPAERLPASTFTIRPLITLHRQRYEHFVRSFFGLTPSAAAQEARHMRQTHSTSIQMEKRSLRDGKRNAPASSPTIGGEDSSCLPPIFSTAKHLSTCSMEDSLPILCRTLRGTGSSGGTRCQTVVAATVRMPRHTAIAVEGDYLFPSLIEESREQWYRRNVSCASSLGAMSSAHPDTRLAHTSPGSRGEQEREEMWTTTSLATALLPNARCIALHYGFHLEKSTTRKTQDGEQEEESNAAELGAEDMDQRRAPLSTPTPLRGRSREMDEEPSCGTEVDAVCHARFTSSFRDFSSVFSRSASYALLAKQERAQHPRAVLLAIVTTSPVEKGEVIRLSYSSYCRCMEEGAWYETRYGMEQPSVFMNSPPSFSSSATFQRSLSPLSSPLALPISESSTATDAAYPPPLTSSRWTHRGKEGVEATEEEEQPLLIGRVTDGVRYFPLWPSHLSYYHSHGRRGMGCVPQASFPFTLLELKHCHEIGRGELGVYAAAAIPYGTCFLYGGPIATTSQIENWMAKHHPLRSPAGKRASNTKTPTHTKEKTGEEEEEEEGEPFAEDTYALALGEGNHEGMCFGQGLARYINHRYNLSPFGNVELCSLSLSMLHVRYDQYPYSNLAKENTTTTVSRSGTSTRRGGHASSTSSRSQPISIPFFMATTDITPGSQLLAWTYGEDYDARLERLAITGHALVPFMDAEELNQRCGMANTVSRSLREELDDWKTKEERPSQQMRKALVRGTTSSPHGCRTREPQVSPATRTPTNASLQRREKEKKEGNPHEKEEEEVEPARTTRSSLPFDAAAVPCSPQRYAGDYRFALKVGDVVWRRRPALVTPRETTSCRGWCPTFTIRKEEKGGYSYSLNTHRNAEERVKCFSREWKKYPSAAASSCCFRPPEEDLFVVADLPLYGVEYSLLQPLSNRLLVSCATTSLSSASTGLTEVTVSSRMNTFMKEEEEKTKAKRARGDVRRFQEGEEKVDLPTSSGSRVTRWLHEVWDAVHSLSSSISHPSAGSFPPCFSSETSSMTEEVQLLEVPETPLPGKEKRFHRHPSSPPLRSSIVCHAVEPQEKDVATVEKEPHTSREGKERRGRGKRETPHSPFSLAPLPSAAVRSMDTMVASTASLARLLPDLDYKEVSSPPPSLAFSFRGLSYPTSSSSRWIAISISALHARTLLVRQSSTVSVPPLLNGFLWPLFVQGEEAEENEWEE